MEDYIIKVRELIEAIEYDYPNFYLLVWNAFSVRFEREWLPADVGLIEKIKKKL